MSNIKSEALVYTAQKMMFSVKAFFGKFDQIHRFLRIWSHLLKKSLMENLIFCAVYALIIPIFSRVHPFNTYAKFSEKLTFLTP